MAPLAINTINHGLSEVVKGLEEVGDVGDGLSPQARALSHPAQPLRRQCGGILLGFAPSAGVGQLTGAQEKLGSLLSYTLISMIQWHPLR